MAYLCYKCQSITDHQTKVCPFMVCKICKENGHSKKDCKYLVEPPCENCLKFSNITISHEKTSDCYYSYNSVQAQFQCDNEKDK